MLLAYCFSLYVRRLRLGASSILNEGRIGIGAQMASTLVLLPYSDH